MKKHGFILAGVNSGVGKTTITLGLLRALRQHNAVQSYKVGPDYIDPAFHFFASGRKCRNLDAHLLEENTLQYLFYNALENADVAVVEGVMGLFDGRAGTNGVASTAHVSKILKQPVILIVDGSGSHTSVAAVVKGFETFDDGVHLLGVIVNRVSSEAHYQLIKEAIESHTKAICFGYLKKSNGIHLASRHLGLIPAEELEGLDDQINQMAAAIQETVDLESLLEHTTFDFQDNWREKEFFKPIQDFECSQTIENNKMIERPLRLGVARDKAFSFYYEDHFSLFEKRGIEVCYFSPLVDAQLPSNLDGIYFGGGFPEVFAAQLEANVNMRRSIKELADQGLPIFAECGGLMYLTESITNFDGLVYQMVGIFNLKTTMTEKLQRFGYVKIENNRDNLFGRCGTAFTAHEFHRSLMNGEAVTSYHVTQSRSNKENEWFCGYTYKNVLAGYGHVHFYGNQEGFNHWVETMVKYQGERKK